MVQTADLAPARAIGILAGPTASGKTAVALDFARQHGHIEIVNADSLLVYREMNIGTAKPTPEELSSVPHHLIDIRTPDENFTAGDFVREAEAAIADILRRGRAPLLVGGTGFYLKVLLKGLWEAAPSDPAIRAELEARETADLFTDLRVKDAPSAEKIGAGDRYRIIRALEMIAVSGTLPSELRARPRPDDPRFRLWVIDRPDEELGERIQRRTRIMLQTGLLDETRSVRERWPEARALHSIGYDQVLDYLDARTPPGRKVRKGIEGLADEIELATRQLVKRQRTWFRGQTSGEHFLLDRDRETLLKRLHEVYG